MRIILALIFACSFCNVSFAKDWHSDRYNKRVERVVISANLIPNNGCGEFRHSRARPIACIVDGPIGKKTKVQPEPEPSSLAGRMPHQLAGFCLFRHRIRTSTIPISRNNQCTLKIDIRHAQHIVLNELTSWFDHIAHKS